MADRAGTVRLWRIVIFVLIYPKILPNIALLVSGDWPAIADADGCGPAPAASPPWNVTRKLRQRAATSPELPRAQDSRGEEWEQRRHVGHVWQVLTPSMTGSFVRKDLYNDKCLNFRWRYLFKHIFIFVSSQISWVGKLLKTLSAFSEY